ncbi:MAG: hypothetical protein R3B06_19905 [Kofleriaceae bacterium]
MRRTFAWFFGVVLVAGCGPKVDPQSPFEVDDPRAGRPTVAPIDAAVPDAPQVAVPGPGVRTLAVSRAALLEVLDAGPAELLAGFEVSVVRPDGAFRGWRLVRLLPKGTRFTGLDLAPGDILLGINGHRLESPPDLGDLLTELRAAATIDASLERDGLPFTIHADVTP